jgi:hypothetical protein
LSHLRARMGRKSVVRNSKGRQEAFNRRERGEKRAEDAKKNKQDHQRRFSQRSRRIFSAT